MNELEQNELTPDENYLICVWPDGSWCYSHSFEVYQSDMGLSDDYFTDTIVVCDSVIDVDSYIDDLVCGGSL